MAKRHRDALEIQGGACNPCGIANSLVEAFREIIAKGGNQRDDHACRLILHQLCLPRQPTDETMEQYRSWRLTVERRRCDASPASAFLVASETWLPRERYVHNRKEDCDHVETNKEPRRRHNKPCGAGISAAGRSTSWTSARYLPPAAPHRRVLTSGSRPPCAPPGSAVTDAARYFADLRKRAAEQRRRAEELAAALPVIPCSCPRTAERVCSSRRTSEPDNGALATLTVTASAATIAAHLPALICDALNGYQDSDRDLLRRLPRGRLVSRDCRLIWNHGAAGCRLAA
jgi:hypothetical protein